MNSRCVNIEKVTAGAEQFQEAAGQLVQTKGSGASGSFKTKAEAKKAAGDKKPKKTAGEKKKVAKKAVTGEKKKAAKKPAGEKKAAAKKPKAAAAAKKPKAAEKKTKREIRGS